MSRRARTRRDKRAPQPDFDDDTTAAYGHLVYKRTSHKPEIWVIDHPTTLDLGHWAVEDYGPLTEDPFSGWRVVSGGPFMAAGGWTNREDALRGAAPWIINRFRVEAQHLNDKAERTTQFVSKLLHDFVQDR